MEFQNPLIEEGRTDRMPEGCTVVIFGASGDLTRRKLIPALLELARQGVLPPGFTVLGVARTEMSDAEFRAHLHEGLKEFGEITEEESGLWETFAQGIRYRPMDPSNPEEYQALRTALDELRAERGVPPNVLFYLSTPPNLYAPIVQALGRAGLQQPGHGGFWVRLVIEKPFGFDLESARRLNSEILEVFREEQIYRIDHYLGKETVQNLIAFRFANGIFEPIWNRNYIDHVQITAAETVGVENRGGYYEQAGALRDMVQNHMLQLLALTAMEPPVVFDAQQVRDEKQKVFQAIRPIPEEEIHLQTVRAQYAPGTIAGRPVPGYRQERGVSPGSSIETYVALRMTIDNWRWADVPFFIRAGKRLPKRVTEIAVQFKKTPHHLFARLPAEHLERNAIVIRIQPDEGISLRFSSKVPGSAMRMRPVTMDFRYGSSFGRKLLDAYARLLQDCMLGDATLFARGDSVEAAWELITPVHEAWKANSRSELYTYAAGSWGPEEADTLLRTAGARWRLP
jgi:glucose-6-phosphate 1-dehydrogenase